MKVSSLSSVLARTFVAFVLLLLLAAMAIMPGSVSTAFAAGIADIPWNKSNVETLRTLDKPEVVRLLSDLWDDSHPFSVPKAGDIGEFAWADLAGDGQYELVMTLDVNGRHFYNALVIYNRDSSGKLTCQEIRGWAIRDLGKAVRDLDGDGKDELIIPSQLASDRYRGASGMAIWPAVYRQKNGEYVEASREFPRFYDSEVLPDLEKKIEAAREKAGAGLETERGLARMVMARDKVLRIIGRDPVAGERDAREWMKSGDPDLRQDAAAVFGDIGGHEDELRALSADKNPQVSRSAEFAMKHGGSSIERFNSAVPRSSQ